MADLTSKLAPVPLEKPASGSTARGKGRRKDVTEGSMLDVAGALDEITRVPAADIHRAAAYSWASRAIAGYRVCAGKLDVQEGLSYLYLGEHYREAALAHAAMGEAWKPLYEEIDAAMATDRAKAFESMRNRAPVATK
jgi:hypothetical protein